ncbi:Lrp/AsnC family transcriptional regulator [Streptacidiphilus sp. P02-A3a]|uniref:Lrp/AsnC family transcriptional regulator n=1 Tax=Streptacidiphilus sp. P02-A3a TaxID=2704468 RepID=UPI0015F842AF|nr:Lrp/AsnC family transcriptional regulator [Streptacidiphilus sp. P02-A3a]QMU69731.1 Lrp/AsnC family transcriptional regulator [Streptacidiphilus sp. P02-A3a]
MDPVDRQLIHALYVDGRAAFSRIAEVLGVSDQTVARRYRRLSQEGALRVHGRLDPGRLGHVVWVLRLQCAPGTSGSVAEALAKRDDTHWIRLASGGTEVICNVQAEGERDRDALLLKKLPATRPVTAISAYCVMHTFRGGPTSWHGVTCALTDEQAALLAPPPVTAADRSGPVELDQGDRALLAGLARDGRATHAALAEATGWHEATVRRRIAHLRASGALYFDIDVDDRLLGYASPSLLWISVEPGQLAAAGEALARHPEISFAAATTGPSNLLASVLCPDVYALYEYIANRVGGLPGIRGIETAPIIRTVKRSGAADRPGRG